MISDLLKLFPALAANGYQRTSLPTRDYNCIAWAATGKTNEWWEPDPLGINVWPDSAPRHYTLHAYVKAFESVGFKKCSPSDIESGYEMVVLYQSGSRCPHAARRLDSGQWTSKLGALDDISHHIDGLSDHPLSPPNDRYGKPKIYMRRQYQLVDDD